MIQRFLKPFKYLKKPSPTWVWLFSQQDQVGRFYSVIVVCMIMTMLAEMSFIGLTKMLVEYGFSNHTFLFGITTILLITILVRCASKAIMALLVANYSQHLITKVTLYAYNKSLRMPFSKLQAIGKSELAGKIQFQVSEVSLFFNTVLVNAIQQILIIIGLVAAMLYLSWILCIMTLLVMPVLFVLMKKLKGKQAEYLHRMQDASASSQQLSIDAFSGIDNVKSHHAYDFISKYYTQTMACLKTQNIKTQRLNAMGKQVVELFAMLPLVVFLYIIAIGWLTISLSTFVAIIAATARIRDPIGALSGLNLSIQRAMVSADKLYDFMMQPNEVDGTKPYDVFQNLTLNNVSFKYPNQLVNTLSNIHFTLEKGEKVLLLGRSGCGKSTLLKLMAGLYVPDGGDYVYNGHVFQDYSLLARSQAISYATQHNKVFNMSLEENITMGRSIDQERFLHVCEQAVLLDLIDDYSDGAKILLVMERTLEVNNNVSQ